MICVVKWSSDQSADNVPIPIIGDCGNFCTGLWGFVAKLSERPLSVLRHLFALLKLRNTSLTHKCSIGLGAGISVCQDSI